MPVPTHEDTTSSETAGLAATLKAPAKVKKKGGKTKAATSSRIDLNTQLFDAVLQEKERVVRRLLDSGTDPNLTNALGETPLMLACGIHDSETRGSIIRNLLKKGANVNMLDSSGQTALMKAILRDNAEAVFVLCESSSDLEAEDRQGNNVLCHAVLSGNEEVVRRVLMEFKKRGLDVDKRNMRGLTPLLIACQEGNLGVAQLLVEEGGASPSIRDLDNFMTAADWMRQAVCCSSPDLAFLITTKRRLHYQQNPAAVRRPHDNRLSIQGSGHFKSPFGDHRMVSKIGREGFPQIPLSSRRIRSPSLRTKKMSSSFQLKSPVCEPDDSPMKSMFDLPSLAKPAPVLPPHPQLVSKPVPTQRISNPELPYPKSFKNDLYTSTYLTKRSSYIVRNQKSEFYSHGALEPLGINTQERISQLAAQIQKQEAKKAHSLSTRHNALPPLKRKSSRTN